MSKVDLAVWRRPDRAVYEVLMTLHVQYVFEIRIYHKYTVYPALLQIH